MNLWQLLQALVRLANRFEVALGVDQRWLSVIACLCLLSLCVAAMLRYRWFAYPWAGVGDEVETFESLSPLMRFLPLGILIAVLVVALAWAFASDETQSSPPPQVQTQSNKGSATGKEDAPAHDPANKTGDNQSGATVPQQLAAIAGDLHAMAQRASPDLLPALDRIDHELAVISRQSPPESPPLGRLDDDLRTIAAKAPANMADPLAAIANDLHSLAAHGVQLPAELTQAVAAIAAALAVKVPPDPDDGAAVAALDQRLGRVEQQVHDLASSHPDAAWEAMSLIEALVWEIARPPVTHCAPLPRFAALLSGPTPAEAELLGLARRRGLTIGRSYQSFPREIFFNPGTAVLSPIGERVLRLTVDTARRRGFALAIDAEADGASDGVNAADLTRDRARTIASFVKENGTLPVVGIGAVTVPGSVSEPYRRVVHVDLLQPCQ